MIEKFLLNFCDIAVLREAKQTCPFSRLTQSLIFNKWPSENGSGDDNDGMLHEARRLFPRSSEIFLIHFCRGMLGNKENVHRVTCRASSQVYSE